MPSNSRFHFLYEQWHCPIFHSLLFSLFAASCIAKSYAFHVFQLCPKGSVLQIDQHQLKKGFSIKKKFKSVQLNWEIFHYITERLIDSLKYVQLQISHSKFQTIIYSTTRTQTIKGKENNHTRKSAKFQIFV